MTTKKEQALLDLDRTYAEFKELIQSAPEDARFSMAAVLVQIEDDGCRAAFSLIGDTPIDIVLAASTVFGFSSGLSKKFKNPEYFVETVNAGIQYGTSEFPKAKEAEPCSTAAH
ncbi:hypothetical protein [Acetobacter sp. A11-2]|uniref:hypothetical protein n=1 Tax=Acetobacter sp. A11-2 TaxID=3157859 RepID=UPI0032ECC9D2